MSPQFIVLVHLFVGCVARYFYLRYAGDAQPLTYFLPIDDVSYWELLLFVGSYLFFYFIFSALKARPIPNLLAFEVKGASTYKRVFLATSFFLLAYYTLMILNFGGFGEFLDATINRSSARVQGLAYVSVFADLAYMGAAILFFINRVALGRHKKLTFFLLALSVLTLGFQGGRGNILQFLITIFIISDCLKGRKIVIGKNGVVLFILFIVLATSGLAARKSNQLDISFVDALEQVNSDLVNSVFSPLAIFDHYELSKEYVYSNGFDYGATYIDQLTKPIPRKYWSDKPQPLGKKMRLEFWGDEAGGIPAGLVGEGYISVGITGVIFVSIVLAAIVARLRTLYNFSYVRNEYVVFAAIIIPYVGINLIRTGVDTGFTRIMIYVCAFFFFKFLCKYRLK